MRALLGRSTMRDLLGPVVLAALLVGLSAASPRGIPNPARRWAAVQRRPSHALSQPSLPRPSGPSSTIEVPPPIN